MSASSSPVLRARVRNIHVSSHTCTISTSGSIPRRRLSSFLSAIESAAECLALTFMAVFFVLLFILLLRHSITYVDAAATVTTATLETHTIDLSRDMQRRQHHHKNSASDSSSTSFLPASANIARIGVITIHFDEPVWITRDTAENRTAVGIGDDNSMLPISVAAPSYLQGLARLICGFDLIESHPAATIQVNQTRTSSSTSLLPDYLLLTASPDDTQLQDEWPLLGLLAQQLNSDVTATPSNTVIRGYFLLGSSSASGRWQQRTKASSLERCELRILDRTSQSWLPTGAIHGANDAPIVTRVPLIHIKHSQRTRRRAMKKSATLSAPFVRNLVRTLPPHPSSTASRRSSSSFPTKSSTFLETQTEAATHSTLQFAPMLKPIVKGLVSSVGAPIGKVVASFTADGILDLVAEKVLAGVSDALQSGFSIYITSDVATQVIPGVCETVTSALVENIARGISEAVVRGCTNVITTDVATRVTHTITDPIIARSSQFIALKLSKTLHHSLTHILSRSIPHIIVPSLINTVSVGLKEDYYCYFCSKKKLYCEYCAQSRGDTSSRLYYALYYTGYHSSYYSQWYSSSAAFGKVLMLSKTQMNPFDDEVDDSEEKLWNIKGRFEEKGTQKLEKKPAKVIKRAKFMKPPK